VKLDATLLVDLGVLFLLLGVLGAIAWRVGLSPVPLFLVAGLFVGQGGVLPAAAAKPFLDVTAGLGVILLLLTLGLQFSPAEFTVALRRHTPSGVLDLVLNGGTGLVAGWLLGLSWPGALALAGITWVSSSGIVARTLHDLGRMGNRETPAVLSVLVLEDVAMAVYLPLLVVVLAGAGLLGGLASAALALGVVLTVLALAGRVSPQVGRLLAHEDDEQLLFRLLGITLIVAGLAESLQVSAAVGAFLVGLAIPERTAERARRVLAPLRDLFAAAFFLSFGYATDPASVTPVLGAAFALAVVTGLTKVATGWLAAARDGVGTRGRWRAGTVLVARGEFSIVIAGLAVSAGIPALGPLATAYVLVLAVAGPLVTRLVPTVAQPQLQPHERSG
jgi:CPA2 family monovalent cation:H+ antiporter-2